MRLNLYEEIITLYNSDEKQVILVRDKLSHVFYIKKIIQGVSNTSIYDLLKNAHHPNLVNVIDVMNNVNTIILIEEFVNGISLEYQMSKHDMNDHMFYGIMMELFDALEHLHQITPPIIHRDIKPANIFIDAQRHIKLMDMEIARCVDLNKQRDTRIMGSAGYAAPEQYGFLQSDERSDIYSLGVLMKELYFHDIYMKLDNSAIANVIQRCTRMEPSQRYQNIEQLRCAFMDIYHEEDYKKQQMKSVFMKKENFKTNIITGVLYVVFFIMSMTVTLKNEKSIYELWIMRICFFCILSSILLIVQNVGRIQEVLPLYRSKYKIIRLLNGVIIWFGSAFFILIITALIITFLDSML